MFFFSFSDFSLLTIEPRIQNRNLTECEIAIPPVISNSKVESKCQQTIINLQSYLIAGK